MKQTLIYKFLLFFFIVAAVSVVDSKIIQDLEFFESMDSLQSDDQDTILALAQEQELKNEEMKDVNYED